MFALQLSLYGNLLALQEYLLCKQDLLTLLKAMEIIGRALKMAKYQKIMMQQQQLWQQSLFQEIKEHISRYPKKHPSWLCSSG
jgi:hypothetical protein